MDQNRNTADFTRQTVLNFRFLDPNSLAALRADLGLKLPPALLLRCREHFRLREGRDPTVGELRFLDAYVSVWRTLPGAVAIADAQGSEEDRRVLADLKRKCDTLEKEGVRLSHTVTNLVEVCGRYLARSGIPPYHRDLRCGHSAELAALCPADTKAPVIECIDTAATLLKEDAAQQVPYPVPVLLLPTGREPFAMETARFFATHRGWGLKPVAAPLDEGLFPHLAAFSNGLFLDASIYRSYDPVRGAASLLPLGCRCLLFLAPHQALPQLFAEGAPIAPCGALNGSRRLVIGHGSETLLSLSFELLQDLRYAREVTPILPARNEQIQAKKITEQSGTLLGGVTCTGGCAHAVLTLLGEAAAKGIDLRRITLSSALELPAAQEDGAAGALPHVLDLHRVCAELSLPSCNHRQLLRADLAEPRMTVFLAAEHGAPREADFAAAWQAAADARDYAAMRALLYSTH